MPKLKLIVFDWDGTIADSIPNIIECKQFLAKKYNAPIPRPELIRAVIGQDFHQALHTCFPTVDEHIFNKIAQQFRITMLEDRYQAALFDGAIDVLKQLKQDGYKLAIATSKSRIELDHALRFNRLEIFFDITCCSEERASKPSPDMLNFIISHFQIPTSEAIMVGDAIADMKFAKNASVRSVAFTRGAASRQMLEEEQPYAIFDDWQYFYKDVILKC